jgi:branched-chain amino acid transport system permease protein
MLDISLPALAAQVFTGLVLGMIYVLLAIGLSLIFGLMTVVNFSHGTFYMLGAYFGFFLLGLSRSFWVALVFAPLLVGVFGLVVERLLIRPLYGRSIDDPLLLTFGLSLVLVEAARLIWGRMGPRRRRQPRLHGRPRVPPLRRRDHGRRPRRSLALPREDAGRPRHPRRLA